MNNLTKGLGDELKGHSPEELREKLESYKLAEALREGSMEIPEEIRHEMDRLKQALCDTDYNDTQCHGCDVNKKFGCACPCQKGNVCGLRVTSKDTPVDFSTIAFRRFCRNIGSNLISSGFKEEIADRFPPQARFDILRLYDQFLAYFQEIHYTSKYIAYIKMDTWELRNRIDELLYLGAARERVCKEMPDLFKTMYEYANYYLPKGYTPSAEELRDAYEVDQYQRRLEKGEPVIFENGRCMFDGYVVSQGYLPGPFPGLEFWTTGPSWLGLWEDYENLVDPKQFTKWLEDTKSERERSKLPPVGYTGSPVCGICAMDVFNLMYSKNDAIGPETYKYALKMMEHYL